MPKDRGSTPTDARKGEGSPPMGSKTEIGTFSFCRKRRRILHGSLLEGKVSVRIGGALWEVHVRAASPGGLSLVRNREEEKRSAI